MGEAVLGLVASFADTRGAAVEASLPLYPETRGDEETLVYLLEEVIYSVEVRRMVPIDVALHHKPLNGLLVIFRLAALERARIVGTFPKAVSWHDLHIAPEPSGIWWRGSRSTSDRTGRTLSL